ncbi:MAG: glycosyltransferase [Candidatus Dormibacteraeota bacterium]|nr:glycosyltransferase [Candidatus Dormibacteraeota bacterium]
MSAERGAVRRVGAHASPPSGLRPSTSSGCASVALDLGASQSLGDSCTPARSAPRLSYVLPVHNQERVIATSVERLLNRLAAFPGSEVILVENGSTDASPVVCAQLAGTSADDCVAVRVTQSETGMGNALRRGIAVADGDVLVLSAADLPFEFTDLDALLAIDPRPRLAIGSKAHPRSRTQIPAMRRTMSEAFRLLRLAVLGLRVRDSQGTILIDAALARAIAPHLRCGDFLISTEIVVWSARLGVTPVELPVTYRATPGSTVSPLGDSVRMARGLFSLRRRLQSYEGSP